MGKKSIGAFKFTAQAPKAGGDQTQKAEGARCGHAGGVKKKKEGSPGGRYKGEGRGV